jgi:hypothetical protein
MIKITPTIILLTILLAACAYSTPTQLKPTQTTPPKGSVNKASQRGLGDVPLSKKEYDSHLRIYFIPEDENCGSGNVEDLRLVAMDGIIPPLDNAEIKAASEKIIQENSPISTMKVSSVSKDKEDSDRWIVTLTCGPEKADEEQCGGIITIFDNDYTYCVNLKANN